MLEYACPALLIVAMKCPATTASDRRQIRQRWWHSPPPRKGFCRCASG